MGARRDFGYTPGTPPATPMLRLLPATVLLATALSATGAAQEAGPFPKGTVAPNVHHTGTVWLNGLVEPGEGLDVSATLATFAPGAILDWHTHPGGQVLLVTEGEGYVQEAGGAVRLVRAGDVVSTPPGVAHWHASTPERGVAYLAIAGDPSAGPTQWGEPVSAETYALGARAVEQELLALSRQKWRWMADRNLDALGALFAEDAVFVHMGGTMTRAEELAVIESGRIHYRHAEVEAASVRVVGGAAIVLNTIRLDAVVGGAEVSHPFEVTEVYVRDGGAWALASLSFTLLRR